MAQLDISGASIGYDQGGITTYVNNLKANVIDEMIQYISQNIITVQQSVDEVWVGQSANAFKEKFDRDSQTVMDTLRTIKENLESEFAQVAQNVDNYDSDLANTINSQQ